MYACVCFCITEEEIDDEISAGARTEEEIGERCGAGTSCGTCVERLGCLLEQARSVPASSAPSPPAPAPATPRPWSTRPPRPEPTRLRAPAVEDYVSSSSDTARKAPGDAG